MNDSNTHEWMLPLRRAANDFLEVLVDQFKVTRHENDKGFSLELDFGPESPAIWHRRGKDEVRANVGGSFDDQARTHAEALEQFFFGSEGKNHHFNDPAFPFRFCSGGALPIVTIQGRQYYRLHWRDIHPVGWNITNGGSDSIAEMLNPARIIQRELSEELIIFDMNPKNPSRLVIGGEGVASDAFPSPAWRKWHARLLEQDMDHRAMRNTPLPCGWLHGPDDLDVNYFDSETSEYLSGQADGMFLNINAEDFGIEVDRVLSFELPKTAVICDGELLSDKLLNSPVGLFEVDKVHEGIAHGSRKFIPSILFFGARDRDPAKLDKVIQDFLREKEMNGLRPAVEKHQLEEAGELRFDLCPVARNIIRRCMAQRGDRIAPGSGIEVFISFASEDEKLAKSIYDYLTSNGRSPVSLPKQSVFFSKESVRGSDFTQSILSALDQARNMVVVGSRVDHLQKNWVSYEYRSFFRKMMSESPSKRQIFTVLAGLPPTTKPPAPLSDYEIFTCADDPMEQDLERLLESFGQDPTTS